jgi:hypothetical protein
MFKLNVYKLQNLYIVEHFLNNKLKLITFVSYIYSLKNNTNTLNKLNNFFLKTWSINWVRVSFRGKGFRLRKFKKLNKLTFNFGHSHWSKMLLDSSKFFFKKIKRQNYMCLLKSYSITKTFKKEIKFIKLLNSYTKRGLRLRKQYIRRRFGKVSQVVSSLH